MFMKQKLPDYGTSTNPQSMAATSFGSASLWNFQGNTANWGFFTKTTARLSESI